MKKEPWWRDLLRPSMWMYHGSIGGLIGLACAELGHKVQMDPLPAGAIIGTWWFFFGLAGDACHKRRFLREQEREAERDRLLRARFGLDTLERRADYLMRHAREPMANEPLEFK